MKGEGVGAKGDGAVGADLGGHDSDAFLGVVDDFVGRAVDFDFPRIATGKRSELGIVVEVVDFHLHAVEFVATHGFYFAAHFPQEGGHEEFTGSGYASADDHKSVDEGGGGGDGIAENGPQFFETADGGGLVAGEDAFGDVVDVFWGEAVIAGAGQFSVDALHGPNGGPVFEHDAGMVFERQAEDYDAGVIPAVEMAVDDDSYAEAGADGVADEVTVLFVTPGFP